MKNNKIILTFDLELWHEGRWLAPYIRKEMRTHDVLTESVLPLLEILKRRNHHATFFVTGMVLEKYGEVIKKIHDEGHEIASHNKEHMKLEEITPEDFEKDMTMQCNLIASLTGKRPLGFRAPHFSLNEKTSWILPILARLGFTYDSSIFPIKTREYGVEGAPRAPYGISFTDITAEDTTSPLLEIPQATLKTACGLIPVAGGIYFRLMPAFLFNNLFLRAVQQGSTPMLYFHPHELCTATPRIRGPFLKTILKYWGVNRSLKKFEYLADRFQFDSIENIFKLNDTKNRR